LLQTYFSDVLNINKINVEEQLIQPKLQPKAAGLLSAYRDKSDSNSKETPINLIPITNMTSMTPKSDCYELELDLSRSVLKDLTAGQTVVPFFIRDDDEHERIYQVLEERSEEFIENPQALQEFLDKEVKTFPISENHKQEHSYLKLLNKYLKINAATEVHSQLKKH
jgi:hypothetical protein